MSIPAWRQRQLDDAEREREARATERMANLFGLVADEDEWDRLEAEEPTRCYCARCWRLLPSADLILDGRGGMRCRDAAACATVRRRP
jgi:hypothetical protein